MHASMRYGLGVVALTALMGFSLTLNNPADFVTEYFGMRYHKKPHSLLYVGVKRQRMYWIKNGQLMQEYVISTSRYGCGQKYKSEKTPLGLHKVNAKIGKDAPIGGVIIGPTYSGRVTQIEKNPVSTGKDELTTRAIRLEGMENGLNKGGDNDTYKREIYIHGTPEEGLIGTPVSHGCIRMLNTDVKNLFDKIDETTYVLILEN